MEAASMSERSQRDEGRVWCEVELTQAEVLSEIDATSNTSAYQETETLNEEIEESLDGMEASGPEYNEPIEDNDVPLHELQLINAEDGPCTEPREGTAQTPDTHADRGAIFSDSDGSGASTPLDDISSSDPTSASRYSISPPGRSTPPPSYEECMKEAIPLSFVDFWPHCLDAEEVDFIYTRFESFDRVVEDANRWLKQHAGIVVRNCETVELKCSTLDEYLKATTNKSSIFKTKYRPTLYIKGLRVWYSSMIINKLPCSFATTPCTLAYINIRPSNVSLYERTNYERFSSLVDKCNNLSKCGVFRGRLLTAETVSIKEPEYDGGAIINMTTDLDQCTWRDTYNKVALQFLRVFYLPDQAVREELAYKDMLPECTRKSKNNPKFGDFSTIMDDCRLWILQQLDSSYRLLNSQTVDTKYYPHGPKTTHSDLTFHSDYESMPRLRFLRIYYAKKEVDCGADHVAPLLCHRTFVPVPVKRRQRENMASLMQFVETWLRATGATVVCAETITLLEQSFHDKGEADSCVIKSEWVQGCSDYDQQETLLYAFRLYLDTVYPEPTPQQLDPALTPEAEMLEEECVIL